MTGPGQPRPAPGIVAEVTGNFCEHDGIPGRCPMCRAAAAAPPAATPRPGWPPVAGDDEDEPELAVIRGWDR